MTTFNEREKSFEKKYAMDEEARFKADALQHLRAGGSLRSGSTVAAVQ